MKWYTCFKCDSCPKVFALSTALENHKTIHGIPGRRVGAALSVSQFHIMSVAVVFMPLYPALCPSHLLSLLCLAASIWDKIMRTDIAQPSLWRCRAGAAPPSPFITPLYPATLLSIVRSKEHIGAVQYSAVQCSAASFHSTPFSQSKSKRLGSHSESKRLGSQSESKRLGSQSESKSLGWYPSQNQNFGLEL